jgi:aspartate/tyrosine/aromatic aminotransferase
MTVTNNTVGQSFAKNAGLYGERVGALHVVPPSKEAADRVKSQLSVLQRSEISNPPTYGARLVSMSTVKVEAIKLRFVTGFAYFERRGAV